MRRVFPNLASILLLAATVAGCGTDTSIADERSGQARDAAVRAGVDEEIADLLALAARGEAATYTVRYVEAGSDATIVVRNIGLRRRVDVTTIDGDVTAVLTTTTGSHDCHLAADESLTACQRTSTFSSPVGAFSQAALDEISDALAAGVEDFAMSVERRAVAGVDARCLVVERRAERDDAALAARGTLCFSPSGVLLLLEQGPQRLEAIEYEAAVDERLLELPA